MEFDETKGMAVKWNPYFSAFLQMIDRKTGSFLHLPFSGGILEQPAKTMTIFLAIQEEYLKTLTEALKRK